MSVSAGMGHVRAAEALEKTFAAHESVLEVVNNDALLYTNKLFRDFYSTFYSSLTKSAPNFLGWWYKTSDEPWRTDAMRQMIDRLNTKPLVRFIRDFDPHITVCRLIQNEYISGLWPISKFENNAQLYGSVKKLHFCLG